MLLSSTPVTKFDSFYFHNSGLIGTATADWIGPVHTNGSDDQTPGLFTYRQTFNVSDPGTYSFSGKWGTDNCGAISVNGVMVSGTGTTIGANSACVPDGLNFMNLTNFSFTASLAGGVNSLEFNVYNTSLRTAFLVDTSLPLAAPYLSPPHSSYLAQGLSVLALAGVALCVYNPCLNPGTPCAGVPTERSKSSYLCLT